MFCCFLIKKSSGRERIPNIDWSCVDLNLLTDEGLKEKFVHMAESNSIYKSRELLQVLFNTMLKTQLDRVKKEMTKVNVL